jgi:UDP-N-acetylmuramoyl-tripeptide--D-alanyl-D-alanine ligase
MLYEIYQKCGGKVTTDTRAITPGCLYVALRGDRFDGNAFTQQALAAGAAYCIIDNAEYATDARCILVDDSLKALQDLAAEHRQTMLCPVIGITGSNGKTTTKELVFRVLDTTYKTFCTKGNLNNHIGVPLTLLSTPSDAEMLVVEMGANHQGEIALLCTIAQPTHGIITSIGEAHLEGFGGIEGVKKGKSELYKYLEKYNGTAFINVEQEFLETALETHAPNIKKVIRYGNADESETARIDLNYTGKLLAAEPFLHFKFGRTEVNSNLFGIYNFGNMLTAVAIGAHFSITNQMIKMGLEAYVPANNRTEIIERNTNTYILDAYNANPTSMQAAIAQFAKTNMKPKRVLILGEMREMGEYSTEKHREMAEFAQAQNAFSAIYLVGEEFKAFAKYATAHFATSADLKLFLQKNPLHETAVLIKGSRGIQLETVLNN